MNLPAFTFGGVGDGLPDGIGQYLKDRRLVILADNDDPGRAHAEEKAAVALAAGAAAIKIVHFEELSPKDDVSDFIVSGGTTEQLTARIDAATTWSPPAPQSAPVAVANVPATAVLVRVSEVTPQPIRWLWPHRIAYEWRHRVRRSQFANSRSLNASGALSLSRIVRSINGGGAGGRAASSFIAASNRLSVSCNIGTTGSASSSPGFSAPLRHNRGG